MWDLCKIFNIQNKERKKFFRWPRGYQIHLSLGLRIMYATDLATCLQRPVHWQMAGIPLSLAPSPSPTLPFLIQEEKKMMQSLLNGGGGSLPALYSNSNGVCVVKAEQSHVTVHVKSAWPPYRRTLSAGSLAHLLRSRLSFQRRRRKSELICCWAEGE